MERQEQAKQLLTRCLNLGISALRSDLAAIDVVELVVRELETDPFFNSGRGSALTAKGTVEMEAPITIISEHKTRLYMLFFFLIP